MALLNIPLGFSKNLIWILNLPIFLNNCHIPITSIAVKMEYLSSLYIESGVEYVAEIAISQAHAAMIAIMQYTDYSTICALYVLNNSLGQQVQSD